MQAPFLVVPAACLGVALLASTSAAEGGDTERRCREWADSVFVAETEAKAREIAKCIAEGDPDSEEARAARRAAEAEEAARAARQRESAAGSSEATEREAAAARARCGGELVPALGPLVFCESPASVRRKAAASDFFSCGTRGDCDRLQLGSAPLPLTAYPKYFEGALYRIAVYAQERSQDEFDTALRRDWEKLVAFAEQQYGAPSVDPAPFPRFFAVNGVYIATTHHWVLGRKRVFVGIFEGDEVYAATLVLEDEPTKALKERGG